MGNCNEAFETLVDYAEGTIDDETRSRLDSHLATGCPRCQQTLNWLRRTIHLMRTDSSMAPPRPVVERAVKLFKQRHAKPRRAIARLLFDSLLGCYSQAGLVGVRSGGTTSRQVLYGTEELDVDLLIEEAESFEQASGLPRQSVVNLLGQVLRRGDCQEPGLSYKITMMRANECIFSGHTDPLGEFAIDNLSSGRYDLHVAGENGELVIEGLELRTYQA